MFPGPKIRDESSEAGDGQKWQLGPIDLDSNTVVLHRGGDATAGGFEAIESVDADGDSD